MKYEATKGDLGFGLSLMSHLEDGNVVVSPHNIRTALGMLYEGARGETAREIAHAARLPEDVKVRNMNYANLTSALNRPDADYELSTANSIWIAQQYNVSLDFIAQLDRVYKAAAHSADFKTYPEKCRQEINKWISKNTNKKIQELLPEGSVNPATLLVLASALYFKGYWQNQFDPGCTKNGQEFKLSNGETVQVDMMRKGEIDSGELPSFPYADNNGVQMVMLPYKGRQLAKVVILPPEGLSVRELEISLEKDADVFVEDSLLMSPARFTRLEIPKHELSGKYDLMRPLHAMGIERIFSPRRADLSGISHEMMFVNAVDHGTYFKTDEEGSEGAAATAIGVIRGGGSSQKPIEFIVDRPYLEMVVHRNSGALLFMNRVEDPTKS